MRAAMNPTIKAAIFSLRKTPTMRLFGILALALMLSPLAWADTIILKGKPALAGVKVQKEGLLEVTYTQGSSTRRRTVATSEVLDIVYDAPPVQYRRGVEYFNLGDHVNAISRLKTSLETEVAQRPWLKEYASIYLGRALMASKQFPAATKAFQGVLADFPEGRRFPAVSLRLARCQIGAGNAAAATTALDNLKSVLKQKKVAGNWDARAELGRVEAQIAAKSFDKAVTTAKALALANLPKDATSEPEKAVIYVRARSLQGEAQIAAGDVSQAKNVYDNLRSRGAGSPLFLAAARTGRAAVIMAGEPDAEGLFRANEMLTRALAENYTAVSELSRTCYLLGLVHLELDGTLTRAKDLAKSYFEETIRRFPESLEAFHARDNLKKM